MPTSSFLLSRCTSRLFFCAAALQRRIETHLHNPPFFRVSLPNTTTDCLAAKHNNGLLSVLSLKVGLMHFFQGGADAFLKAQDVATHKFFLQIKEYFWRREVRTKHTPWKRCDRELPDSSRFEWRKNETCRIGADTSCGGFRRASRSWDRSCHSIFLHSTASLSLFSACVLSLRSECVALHRRSLEHHRLLNSREQEFSRHLFTC